MALNLSTLTSPATSGEVLAEVLTTADFLEPVPVLRNLARGSNKGGDAEQDVALNQPKSLPLIDGDGYLYCPPIAANYAYVENPIIPATADFDLSVEFVVAKFASGTGYSHIASQYQGNTSGRVHLGFFDHQKRLYFFCGGDGTNPSVNLETSFAAIVEGQRHTARVTRVGNTFTLYLDGVLQQTATSGVATLQTVGTQIGWGSLRGLNGAIFSVTEGSNTNVDFTATNVRHGDTKFKCATGQVVTINQDSSSSNDVATIIKKPVLRFDGVNSGLQGLFGQTITNGYFFAAYSVIGNGGENFARIASLNSTGETDSANGKYALLATRGGSVPATITRSVVAGFPSQDHNSTFDDDLADVLFEIKIGETNLTSKLNNANLQSSNGTSTVNAEEFNIGVSEIITDNNAAIDLEYLAFFPSSITDAQADAVRNYINNRNDVFDLKDGFGYYFYDAQKAPVGNISSGSASWNGRIVGSDNGDTDKYATQGVSNDQPVSDGYVVTFADNTDHLDIPSTTQAGWQVVGTSLGTFAYRVNANAVTELNLLGNAGAVRSVGDLYGIILLPESATNADIEEARKLLINRGAADASPSTSISGPWVNRFDIVEFKNTEFPLATTAAYAWENCNNMTTIGPVNAPLSTSFDSAWQGTSSLTTFPAGSTLGTGATNVNFFEAWYLSGLNSFGALDLSTGNNFTSAWKSCSSLTSFPADAKLGTEANNVNFTSAWRSSGITSFSTPLPTATNASLAWLDCTSLITFNAPLPLATNVNGTWYNCSSLTDFSADVFANWNPSSLASGIFNDTWDGCNLTAQSVENILVSIDASGHYATTNKVSGGPALADAGIDIDYNGDPLTAATTAAIDSLSGKGWQVYINGELVIPNILDLEPAAAYSLRSFDADADPNVVNVRRSSDNATSDFTASEVSDGTLVAWVGAGNDGYVTTWYDQGGTNHATQATASSQPKIVDGGVLVTEGGLPSINFHTEVSNLSLDHSDLYGQATLDSYYVTNTTDTQYLYPACGSGSRYGMVAESGSSLTILSEIYGNPSFYANGSQITGGTRDAIYTATSGGQKLVAHQGAGTTDLSWASSMNFGNYQNLTDYSYTGKLQEMIFFNTDQSSNRTGIENNINDHFDIYS
jgi:hypothetical protein